MQMLLRTEKKRRGPPRSASEKNFFNIHTCCEIMSNFHFLCQRDRLQTFRVLPASTRAHSLNACLLYGWDTFGAFPLLLPRLPPLLVSSTAAFRWQYFSLIKFSIPLNFVSVNRKPEERERMEKNQCSLRYFISEPILRECNKLNNPKSARRGANIRE